MSEVLENSKGLSTEGAYFVNAVLCSLDYEQFHKLMTQNMQAVMSREMPMAQFGDKVRREGCGLLSLYSTVPTLV